MTDRVPAICYSSKSTQDRHQSLATQSMEARDMAEKNGWTVVSEHSDEGFSAFSGNRGPGLEAAKRAAIDAAKRTGKPVMLVAQAHDRFARGAGDRPGAAQSLGELWHELRRQDVWLRTVEDDEELRDEASVAAIGRRAHLDSARKSRSVKKGMRRRAALRGRISGGIRPYAYEWTGAKGDRTLVVVPGEAAIVVRLFEQTCAGVSQMALAKQLTHEEIPTVGGGDWLQATVGRILRNPLYLGKVRCAGELFDGEHEAIITEELWHAAERVREAGRRSKGGHYPSSGHLMLHGLARCGLCGSAMLARTDPNRGTPEAPYSVYICDGRRRKGPEFCAQSPVPRAAVDGALFSELSRKYVDLELTRERLRTRVSADAARAVETVVQAERQALKAGERLTRVQRAMQDGYLEPDDYQEQRIQLTEEREAADAALDRAREHKAELDAATPSLDVGDELLAMLEQMRAELVRGISQPASLNALRRLLGMLFEKVVYCPPASGAWWDAIGPEDNNAVCPEGSAVLVPFLRAEVGERLPALPVSLETNGLLM